MIRWPINRCAYWYAYGCL